MPTPNNPYSAKEVDPRLGGISTNTSTGFGPGAAGTVSGQSGLTTTGSDHHYDRDTAAVSGSTAVGEGVHHRRERKQENIGTSDQHHLGRGAAVGGWRCWTCRT